MRAMVFQIPVPTSERQYREMTERIQRHWRERIYTTMQGDGAQAGKLYVGAQDCVLIDGWDEVALRVSPAGFFFRVYMNWHTGSDQDLIGMALLTQHLEVSILPLVYFDDIELISNAHDCEGGPGKSRNCSTCYNAEDVYDAEEYATKHANETIRQHVNAN